MAATGATIQVQRGVIADIPTLASGELYFATDTQAFYVGTGSGNVIVGPRSFLRYVNTSIPGGNTVANTTTETNFASNYAFSANTLAVGNVIRLTARGTYGTDSATPGTTTLRVKFGSTNLCATLAITNLASIGARGWEVIADLVVTAIGVSGTVECQGRATLSGTAATALDSSMVGGSISVDFTASQTLQASMQWSVADLDNTMTLRQFIVEVLQ